MLEGLQENNGCKPIKEENLVTTGRHNSSCHPFTPATGKGRTCSIRPVRSFNNVKCVSSFLKHTWEALNNYASLCKIN